MYQQDKKCPWCNAKKLTKSGKKWINQKKVQQYICDNCGRHTIYPKKI
jgi:transposase-like protein